MIGFIPNYRFFSVLVFYFLLLILTMVNPLRQKKILDTGFLLWAEDKKKSDKPMQKADLENKSTLSNILECSPEEFRMLVTRHQTKIAHKFDSKDQEQSREKRLVLVRMLEETLNKVTALEKQVVKNSREQEQRKSKIFSSLTKSFGSIKSQKAAQILSKVDAKTALLLVKSMSPRKIADLLSALSAEEAAQMTSVLAHTER